MYPCHSILRRKNRAPETFSRKLPSGLKPTGIPADLYSQIGRVAVRHYSCRSFTDKNKFGRTLQIWNHQIWRENQRLSPFVKNNLGSKKSRPTGIPADLYSQIGRVRPRPLRGRCNLLSTNCLAENQRLSPFVKNNLGSKKSRPTGIEPATFASGGRRSIQLSYGRKQPRFF